MRNVLALESSGPGLSVALGTEDGRVRELRARRSLQHSENLIPLIDEILKRGRLKFSDLDTFAIDRGPGSFTGLRIGFSLLKGFLAVRKRPCGGALSLDMIAASVRLPEKSRLGVIVDARRERIYTRFYFRRGNDWRPEGRLELLSLEGLVGRITPGTTLAGEALHRYRAPLLKTFGNQIRLLPAEKAIPRASVLVEWAQTEDERLTPLRSPQDFLPLYFRVPEAEEKNQRRKSHAA